MKRLFYFLPLLAALVAMVGCEAAISVEQASNDFQFPFCRTQSDCGSLSHMDYCSGTLVDRNDAQGLVITCFHCTKDGGPYHVRFCDGQEYLAQLIDSTAQNDMSAMVIQRPDVMPVACGPFTGDGEYTSYGFGPDGVLSKLTGKVIGHNGEIGSYQHGFQMLDAAPLQGDSGSGVTNEDGEFCGVLWGNSSGRACVTMGTPVSDYLRSLVNRGLWKPSAGFAPGGSEISDDNLSSGASLADCGYSADGKTRTVDGQVCDLTSFEVRRTCIGGLCPNLPKPHLPGLGGGGESGGDNPHGRVPLRSPFEGREPEKVATPVGDLTVQAVAAPLVVLVVLAGAFGATARYFRS